MSKAAKNSKTKKTTTGKASAKKSATANKNAKAKVIDMKSKKEMEVSGMKNEAIEALESAGFKRWRKGGYDRLYISAGRLGLRIENDVATFKGEPISVKEGERMRAAKTYIDVHTGEAYSGSEILESEAMSVMSELLSIKKIGQAI